MAATRRETGLIEDAGLDAQPMLHVLQVDLPETVYSDDRCDVFSERDRRIWVVEFLKNRQRNDFTTLN